MYSLQSGACAVTQWFSLGIDAEADERQTPASLCPLFQVGLAAQSCGGGGDNGLQLLNIDRNTKLKKCLTSISKLWIFI